MPELNLNEALEHEDPSCVLVLTYAPKQRRIPRWLKRTLWALLIAGLIFLFYPHGFNRGSITLTCTKCAGQTVYKRIEAIPPRWLFFERYVGWSWWDADSSTNLAQNCEHLWGVNVQADMRMGRVTASGTPDNPSDVVYINGIPHSAERLLDALMAPGNNGVR